MTESLGEGLEVEQSASFGFVNPVVGVVVAVEDNVLVFCKCLFNQRLDCLGKILGVLELVIELTELLGYHGVEHIVGAGDIERRSERAELKLVAREREG